MFVRKGNGNGNGNGNGSRSRREKRKRKGRRGEMNVGGEKYKLIYIAD